MRSPSVCSTRACAWSAIRRPALAGTRLDVWQVIETLRAHDNDIESTAHYFAITSTQVRACVAYYADFQCEIDAYAAAEMDAAARERERWEREQRMLGAGPVRAGRITACCSSPTAR
jgi:uncharacterized protein (DUF433 family)